MQGIISRKPVKKLLRRLLCVTAASKYNLLKSESHVPWSCTSGIRHGTVPTGHLPLYVGEERERFIVSAKLLNHPIFMNLLNKSAEEYGFEQEGVLQIPCNVLLFKRVLESLRLGNESIHDLLRPL